MQDLKKLKQMIDEPANYLSTQIDKCIQLAIAEQTSRLADAQEGILRQLKDQDPWSAKREMLRQNPPTTKWAD